jgi:zinc protease
MTFRSRTKAPLLAVALAALVFLTAPARAAEPPALTKVTTVEGITEYKLANGLRVLLFPDASKPLVTVNLTIFVGSRQEGYGETGMAHLLEHMLFKGTPTHPNVPKALRDHGARFNGTTWVDRTNYFETMPASDDNLEFGIRLEADRLVNSFVKREDLLSEMTVVRNEFEAGENNPEHILSQRMMAVAYEWHNYGKSTIGNRSDIERVPIENLRAFYKKYYHPANAMLVVAGKFDEKKALSLIRKYFGPLKSPARTLEDTYTEEPPQDGERVVTLRRVGSVGALGAVYHIPAGAHPDYPAAALLEDILTSAPSGRLYKALVRKKLASRVSGNAFAWHDPGVIEITATTEPDKLEAARAALIDTLENLAREPITAEEVSRARTRFQKVDERLLDSTDRFAVRLSEWAACGDWRLFFLNRDRIAKVTAADVNRVAAKYLVRSNRTVGVFIPTKAPERASVPATPDVAALVKDYKGGEGVARGEAFDPSPENIEKRVRGGTLDGGVKTAFLPKKTRGEVVNLRLNLRFGNAESLAGKTTAAELLGSLLRRGTAKHTRKELQDELDKLGAQLSVASDAGSLTLTLQVKKPNLPAALKLVEEVLRQPSFPADEFDVLKRETLERLEKGKTEPVPLASTALRRALRPYPKDDVRYVPTIEEDISRVKAVTLEQVKEVYAKQLGATAGELTGVGDFDPEATGKTFAAILKGWKAEVPYKRIAEPAAAGIKGRTETILTPDKANAVYLAGEVFPMMDSDPDYPALEVGNYLLGAAPLASRLSNRVRGKEGLSYGVGSQVGASSTDKAGRFMIFAITNPKNMAKVDKAIKEEVEKFLKGGPTSEELSEGKRAYLEKLKVERSSDGALARQLGDYLFAGRTYRFAAEREKKVKALTAADVEEVFKRYVAPDKLVIVEAGDLGKK